MISKLSVWLRVVLHLGYATTKPRCVLVSFYGIDHKDVVHIYLFCK